MEVTINPTPSEEIIKKNEFEVIDDLGRKIKLKKPAVLAQFRLIEALGDTAKNQTYTSMVLPLIFVTAIDGDAVPAPRSKLEVEALIQRLDEEGIAAVMTGVQDNFGSQDAEADKEALKK